MEELELAFSTDPVVGWRVWRVLRPIDRKMSAIELATELLAGEREGEDGQVEGLFRPRLRSLTQPVYWAPRTELESTCDLVRDGVPAHGGGPDSACECGVWALRTRESADEVFGAYADSGVPVAIGRVALWGRIIEHNRGWRGQFAYPLDLEAFGAAPAAVADLAEQYGVPAQLLTAADLERRGRRAA